MSNNVSIYDLNPRPSSFMLRGKSYELKKFSLAAQVWAHDRFATKESPNGLANLSARVMELDDAAIAQTCYYLLKDKTDFVDEEAFLNAFGDKLTVLKVLLNPFTRCLGVSQPTEDDVSEELELKK